MVLPFWKYITPKINQVLRKHELTPINKQINKFNYMIILGKDTLNKLESSNVVYKVDCSNCNATYVGTTTRKCGLRRNEHRRAVINNKVLIHVDSTGHSTNFDSSKIIDQENNKKKWEFSEVLFIYYYDNTVNRIEDTNKLMHLYKNSIDLIKIQNLNSRFCFVINQFPHPSVNHKYTTLTREHNLYHIHLLIEIPTLRDIFPVCEFMHVCTHMYGVHTPRLRPLRRNSRVSLLVFSPSPLSVLYLPFSLPCSYTRSVYLSFSERRVNWTRIKYLPRGPPAARN